jgi:adenylosuccinate synthase
VTSSHTISGSASIGCGVGPHQIQDVLGVAKAYTTRVGLGPFPTEDKKDTVLRDKGQEYGATTGRPRRCGLFDASVVKYSARLSGVKRIVLTKFDILSGIETLRIAVGYSNGKDFDPFIAHDLTPVYEELPGFKADISTVRAFKDLPDEAKDYVRMIERYTGLIVQYISVGPDRDAVIVKK